MVKRIQNGLRAYFEHRSLSEKMALCLFFTTLFATMVAILLMYGRASKAAIRMNTTLNESNLEVTKNNIEKQILDVEESILTIFFQNELKQGIVDEKKFSNNLAFLNRVNSHLTSFLATVPGIRGAAIYKTNGENILTTAARHDEYDTYQECVDYYVGRGVDPEAFALSSVWTGLENDPTRDGKRVCFVNLRTLLDIRNGQPIAVMVVYYDERAISQLYSFFGANSFVLDEQGVVVSAVDKDRIGTSYRDSPLYEEVVATKKRTQAMLLDDGQKQLSSFCTWLPSLSCYLVAVPNNNVLSATQSAVLTSMLIIALFCVVFSVLSAAILSRELTRPISQLKAVMEQARSGDLSARFIGQGFDEASYLGATFNILMEDIVRYIRRIQLQERLQREGEVKLLQSQINPHLLYNTLDSALYYMSENNIETAVYIVKELSRFFKLSLQKGQMFVPLKTELYHIQCYMELQRLCRKKDIQLCVKGDASLQEVKIMKTTLQPIIENSYLHAYEGCVADGRITVTLSESEGVLSILVTDDGMGIEDETLAALKRMLESPAETSGGFGLWNVNHRLKACYGDSFGLTVNSEFGEYTSVLITLPCTLPDEDEKMNENRLPGGLEDEKSEE